MASRIKQGTYTGTGAAVNVPLGFNPDFVEIINITDGDDVFKWHYGMTAGHAIWSRSVTDNATTGNASITRITSNGISRYAGSSTSGSEAAVGFTAGSAISESGDTFAYLAIGEDD